MQKEFHNIAKIHVGESEFEAEQLNISENDLIQIDDKEYHLLLGDSSIEAKCVYADLDNQEVHLRIEGILYKVKLKNRLDTLVQNLGFNLQKESKEKDVKAPMPGLVLKMLVEVGQSVEKDQDLLILEAMKMENIIQAPKSGVIESIPVKDGDAVEKNQVLISYEDE